MKKDVKMPHEERDVQMKKWDRYEKMNEKIFKKEKSTQERIKEISGDVTMLQTTEDDCWIQV